LAAAQEPVHHDVIAQIKAEGLERSRVMETFNVLTNVIGPRLTATPAFKAAADWSASQLEAWGMSNVHLEAWPFGRGWTLEGLTLEMTIRFARCHLRGGSCSPSRRSPRSSRATASHHPHHTHS